MSQVLRLIIEYDGTNFVGWQRQRVGRSVQAEIEKALSVFFNTQRIPIMAAGRTDSGVHAFGQVASLELPEDVDFDASDIKNLRRLLKGLNGILPRDVVIREVGLMNNGFYARKHASSKLYRYLIIDGESPSPLMKNRAWYVPLVLNVERMAEAANFFVGEHDFTSFRGRGSSVQSSVRKVLSVLVERTRDDTRIIRIEIEGTGFLKHMVRNMVGTLVEVGKGAVEPEYVASIISAKDRRYAGPKAPACGLYLVRVNFNPPFDEPLVKFPNCEE